MPLYRWSSGDIAQMECTSHGKKVYAVLRAQTEANRHVFGAMRAALAENGIASFISAEKGIDELIIPESKSTQQLVDIIADGGWAKGIPQVIATPADNDAQRKNNSRSLLKKDPLLITGSLLTIASLAWMGSAIMRARHNHSGKFTSKDWSEMMVGVINLMGAAPLVLYGRETKKDTILIFHEELTKHLKEEGIVLPQGKDATPEAAQKSGYLGAAENYLKKNTVSFLSLAKAISAGLVAHSATKKETFNGAKIAGGTIYSAAWWATFAFDKPHAPPWKFKSKDGGTSSQSFGQWLTENPRARITAPVGMVTHALKLYGAGNEGYRAYQAIKTAKSPDELKFTKAKRYDFIWNVISYSAAIISNFSFGHSGNKESVQKKDPEGFERDLLMVSANLLTQIPEKARKAAIASAAEYVTSIKGINQSQEEVEKIISDQITHLQKMEVSRPASLAMG